MTTQHTDRYRHLLGPNADDPLNGPHIRDHADVCYGTVSSEPHRAQERITIDRPDRDRDRRTYTPTTASSARLKRLVFDRHWPTRQVTPGGWHGVSTAR